MRKREKPAGGLLGLAAIIIIVIWGLPFGCIMGTANPGQNSAAKAAADTGNTGNTKAEVIVSAAASLKEAMEEIKTLYEKDNREISLVLNFASSGTLQQQIEKGAPVDIFISAGSKQMDALAEKHLINGNTRVRLLSNSLALVVRRDNDTITSLGDLNQPEIRHIAIGQPESVPAGKYTKEALVSSGLWGELLPRFVLSKNVRQVLAYVESGNADAGLVYLSDVTVSDKVKIVETVLAGSHSPITYPAAIIRTARNGAAAEEFLHFLQGDRAGQVFVRYGFMLPAH